MLIRYYRKSELVGILLVFHPTDCQKYYRSLATVEALNYHREFLLDYKYTQIYKAITGKTTVIGIRYLVMF